MKTHEYRSVYLKVKHFKLVIIDFRFKIKEHERRIKEIEETKLFKEHRAAKKIISTLEKHINNAQDKLLKSIK